MVSLPSFGDTFLLAVGLAVFIEGLAYALLARHIPDYARMLGELPVGQIRVIGLVTASVGLAWLVMVRYLWLAP